MPGQSREQLIRRRTKDLLEKGFKPGIVNLSMDWAWGSAMGMASYVHKQGSDNSGRRVEDLAVDFLPQYLSDAEKYIRSFGHEPEKA